MCASATELVLSLIKGGSLAAGSVLWSVFPREPVAAGCITSIRVLRIRVGQ